MSLERASNEIQTEHAADGTETTAVGALTFSQRMGLNAVLALYAGDSDITLHEIYPDTTADSGAQKPDLYANHTAPYRGSEF